MLANKGKISMQQAFLLFLALLFSPTVRHIPLYTAERAKEAAWLAPIPATVVFFLLTRIWNSFYRKYKAHSLMDIYEDIAGKVMAKILAAVYLIWMIMLAGLYVRYSALRLVRSAYPNVDVNLFSICLLLVIAYTMRHGLEPFARFGEVVYPVLTGTFILLVVLIIPYLRLEFLVPVTGRSIVPVFKASTGIIGIIVYFSFFFIAGDRINNTETIKKTGLQVSIFIFIMITLLIVITVGSFSHTIMQRTSLPFLTAVKQISLFNTLEKIESIVVALWILSDYILISFFMLGVLQLLKYMFHLNETKPLISILAVLIYLVSIYLVNDVFELQKLSDLFFTPGNIILGFIIPCLVLFVGMLRKKV